MIAELELYAEAFFGLRGTFPFMLGIYFHRRKIPYRLTLLYRHLKVSNHVLMAYWTKRPFFSTAHIVYAQKQEDGSWLVYNRYNVRDTPARVGQLTEIAPRSRFMMGYYLREK